MIGVLASGEGTNLQALIDAGLPIAAVASNRAEARALERARRGRASRPPSSTTSERWRTGSRSTACALVVLAGYMQLLTPAFLDRFRPDRQRPPVAPARRSRPAGDRAGRSRRACATTGVTVHLVDEGIDTGPVLRAGARAGRAGGTTLVERIHAVEHRLLPEVVRELCAAR